MDHQASRATQRFCFWRQTPLLLANFGSAFESASLFSRKALRAPHAPDLIGGASSRFSSEVEPEADLKSAGQGIGAVITLAT